MAHMLVAGLTARGFLLPLRFHLCSSNLASRSDVIAALRIQSTKRFPRLARSPRVPHHFALKCSPSDDPSSSLTSADVVLLSSNECPDGSILFRFGAPGQRVSEDSAEVPGVGDNGAVTNVHVSTNAEEENVSQTSFTETPEHQGVRIAEQNAGPLSGSDARSVTQANATKELPATKNVSAPYQGECNEKVQENDTILVTTTNSVLLEESVAGKEASKQGLLRLCSGAAMRPHPSKLATGGEDAYLIEGTNWVGVADGVGGWALSGVDAGIYSREFMSNCAELARKENAVPNPKAIIIRSVQLSTSMGTCTAVLAALYRQTLYVANIGDSGFLVVRNGEVLARSTPMQRGFNFPYQIGSDGDDPSIAETFEVPVSSGDVVVLATDGLYDNLYEREIVDMVQAGVRKAVKPEEVAMWLVKLAHSVGIDTSGRSPFSDAAMAAGYSWTGGKLDDVTVLVSYVV